MRLGLNLFTFGDRSLDEALTCAANAGVAAVELPVHQGSPFVELETPGWEAGFAEACRSRGFAISALDNHLDSQLVLGPYGDETAYVVSGSDEERKIGRAHV